MRLIRLLSCVLLLVAAPALAADLVISSGGSFNLGSTTQAFGRVSCMGTLELTPPAMVDATMSVTISGCTLHVDVPAGGMPAGDVTLIDNMGTMRVMGTFTGISQGMALNMGGQAFYMDYMGGDGNDVVLSRIPVPTMPEMMGGAMMPMPVPGANVQSLWWASYESGWGMSLIEHGDSVFGALYVYDANGKPLWAVMPAGQWDASHTMLTGALYTPRGTPYFSYESSHLDVGAAAGSLSITFQDYNGAKLDYVLGAMSGTKYVSRQNFGTGATLYRDNTDLWWGGTAQNGWGITVMQQASTLFSVWFTYDANGAPTWYVMPGGAWTSPSSYEGHVYRTQGTAWASYDPKQLQVMDAGTYRITLIASGGLTFDYSVEGHQGTVPLSREPF